MAGVPEFPQVLASQRAVGTLFNTYTTAKTVINATELVTLPPNYLKIGSKLRIKVAGGLSNVVTTPGTVTFQVMMGSIVAASSGAIQMSTTAHTLIPFNLEMVLRTDTIGSGTTAKFLPMGTVNGIMFTVGAGADSTTVVGTFPIPATAPAVGTGFDSTIANILDFWVGFSISNAANGVQIYDYSVEQLAF
jgi:hypothetical protein